MARKLASLFKHRPIWKNTKLQYQFSALKENLYVTNAQMAITIQTLLAECVRKTEKKLFMRVQNGQCEEK